MNNLPPLWTLDELRSAEVGRAGVWADPMVAARVRTALPWQPVSLTNADVAEHDTLIVVGGGTMIDEAKVAARDAGGPRRLIAVPSIWGSGAEASPVVVLNREGKKQIRVDKKYLPDARVAWPELAETVPAARARQACGDCWAHALEAFLSPLADEALRSETAALLCGLLERRLTNDPCWFELGAKACAAQVRSGVGLVHGIAHTLEHPLRESCPGEDWHHARLCATMLLPVMQFNRDTSDKWNCLNKTWSLDSDAIFSVLRQLFEPDSYDTIVPLLEQNWMEVLRDPCSRLNSALVRPQSIEYFRKFVKPPSAGKLGTSAAVRIA